MDADTAGEWRALIPGAAQKCREFDDYLGPSARLRQPWRRRSKARPRRALSSNCRTRRGFLLGVVGAPCGTLYDMCVVLNMMRYREAVVEVAVVVMFCRRGGGAVVSCVCLRRRGW